MSDFKTWWKTEGSAMRPQSNEDIEEFAKRLTEIAWSNGKYVEREACAKVCEDEDVAPTDDAVGVQQCIAASIRARGNS